MRLWPVAGQGTAGVAEALERVAAHDSVDATDDISRSPLILASSVGNYRAVKWLLDAGADPGRRDVMGRAALFCASEAGRATIVALLLEWSGSQGIDACNSAGWVPMHAAAKHGHVDVVALLLGAGASPAARDFEGRTPLSLAAAAGELETVGALLQTAAGRLTVTMESNFGWTAMAYAINGRSLACARLLAAACRDTSPTNPVGERALERCVSEGHAGLLDTLLEARPAEDVLARVMVSLHPARATELRSAAAWAPRRRLVAWRSAVAAAQA